MDLKQKRMKYKIEQIAKTAHSIHITYCNEMSLKTQPVWEELSSEHKNIVIDSVRKILEGEINTVQEAHKNFVYQKKKQGWIFGYPYSIEKKTNPRLVERFFELPVEERVKESLFFSCVYSFL